MAGNIKGITIEFDGDVSKLQKSLKQLDKATGDVDKKLRAVNKSLKFSPGNTELVTQKQKALADKIGLTEKKLKELKAADKDLKSQLANGKLGQEKYDELQREIVETESKLDHFKSQLGKLNMSKVDDLSKKFENLGSKIKGVGDKVSGFGSSLTGKITAPFIALGGVAVNSAAEAEAAESQFEQVFGNLEDNARKSLGKISKETGIYENSLKGSFTQIAAFMKTSGADQETALSVAERATLAAADGAAFYDKSIEEVGESLQSFLKGNYANDAALGISATETTRNAKANELYGKSFNKLSEEQKQLTLLAMVEDGNKLSGALGQASRESDTLTTQFGNLKQSITDAMVEFATPILPYVVEMFTKLSAKIKEAGEWFKNLSPEMQETMIKGVLLAAALGPVLIVVGKIIGAIGTITSVFGGFIGAMAKVGEEGGLLGKALQFIGSHFTAIIWGIGLVVGAFITLWNTNEEFRNNILGIWETIKQTFSDLVAGIKERLDGLREAFNNIINFIKPIWIEFCNMLAPVFEGAFSIISTAFTTVKDVILGILDVFIGIFTGNWQLAWDGVKGIFSSVWTAIENIINTVITTIGSVISTGVNFVKNTVTSVWNALSSAVTGIWEAMGGSISSVWENIKLGVSNAVDAVSGTVTRIFDNLKGTVASTWDAIKTAITGPVDKAKELVGKAIDAIKGFFNFEFKWPKLKMPHFSISGSINPFSPDFPPKVGVDWYAQGGIFDSPSVIGVGEAGSEAVVPTHKLDKFLADGVSRVLQGLDGTNGKGDIVINVKEMNVREDSDIRRVAEEVQRLIDLKMSRVSNAGGLL